MKTLYLLKSLLSSNKKYIIIISICFIFIAYLFNISVAVTEEYISKKILVSHYDYSDNYAVVRFSSFGPLTDELLTKTVEKAELDDFIDFFSGSFLPLENETISEEDLLYLTEEELNSKTHEVSLSWYSVEYSELFNTEIKGEKPDINKDYGGQIPVIASYDSGLHIGDTITSNFNGEKIVTFKVVAEYKDNNLATYCCLTSLERIFTDKEILYRYGIIERPENLPTFSVDGERRYNHKILIVRPEGITQKEFEARLDYLTEMTLSFPIEYVSGSSDKMLDDSDIDFSYKDVITLIPLIILIFGTGVTGTIANLLISADKRNSIFRIFRICNAKKSSLLLLTILCEFTITLFSLGVALLLSFLTDLFCGELFAHLTQSLISPASVISTSAAVAGITLIMIIIQIIKEKKAKERIL